ncbi:MAG: hypothetical protein AB1567_12380 [bacterium]
MAGVKRAIKEETGFKIGKFFLGFFSRKFLAWVVASIFLWAGKIAGSEWVVVTGIYVGVNIIESAVEGLKKNRKREEDDI